MRINWVWSLPGLTVKLSFRFCWFFEIFCSSKFSAIFEFWVQSTIHSAFGLSTIIPFNSWPKNFGKIEMASVRVKLVVLNWIYPVGIVSSEKGSLLPMVSLSLCSGLEEPFIPYENISIEKRIIQLTNQHSLAVVGDFHAISGAPADPSDEHCVLLGRYVLFVSGLPDQILLVCPGADLLWRRSRSNGIEDESFGHDADLCSLRIRLPRPASCRGGLPVRRQTRSGHDRRDNQARTRHIRYDLKRPAGVHSRDSAGCSLLWNFQLE